MGTQGDEAKFERTPLYQAKEEPLVAVGQLKKWKATKLAILSFFPQDEAEAYAFERSSFIIEAQQLAEAQPLLFQIFAEQNTGTAENLEFCLPTQLYAKKNFAATKLTQVLLRT